MSRFRVPPNFPLKYPAGIPITVASSEAKIPVRVPTMTETIPPAKNCENTSCPNCVVPSRWMESGGWFETSHSNCLGRKVNNVRLQIRKDEK